MHFLIILGIICWLIFACVAIFAWRYIDNSLDVILDASQSAENAKYRASINMVPSKKSNHPLSWSLNFWLNVKDWSYRYGEGKYIIKWDNAEVWFSERKNDMNIAIPLLNGRVDTLTVTNISSQTWNNVCIILDNRYLDVWINNELIVSKHLSNVPQVLQYSSMYVTPYGGFRGRMSKVKLYNRPLKQISYFYANTIQNLYKNGH